MLKEARNRRKGYMLIIGNESTPDGLIIWGIITQSKNKYGISQANYVRPFLFNSPEDAFKCFTAESRRRGFYPVFTCYADLDQDASNMDYICNKTYHENPCKDIDLMEPDFATAWGVKRTFSSRESVILRKFIDELNTHEISDSSIEISSIGFDSASGHRIISKNFVIQLNEIDLCSY